MTYFIQFQPKALVHSANTMTRPPYTAPALCAPSVQKREKLPLWEIASSHFPLRTFKINELNYSTLFGISTTLIRSNETLP
jgi:hypothetical protein